MFGLQNPDLPCHRKGMSREPVSHLCSLKGVFFIIIIYYCSNFPLKVLSNVEEVNCNLCPFREQEKEDGTLVIKKHFQGWLPSMWSTCEDGASQVSTR